MRLWRSSRASPAGRRSSRCAGTSWVSAGRGGEGCRGGGVRRARARARARPRRRSSPRGAPPPAAAAHAPPPPRRAGTALGGLFTIIGLKLTLGTAGILPSLNIPAGLISFAAIKSLTSAGASLRAAERAPLLNALLFQPFGLQENAVMQTYILSMGAGGFGSYITGMGYQAYRNLGGAPRDSPDFDAAAVFDPLPSKTMPYLVLTSVLGAFMLAQLRKLMIVDWRLPFPSGTASGIMLTSFHTAVRARRAARGRMFLHARDVACVRGPRRRCRPQPPRAPAWARRHGRTRPPSPRTPAIAPPAPPPRRRTARPRRSAR